MYSQRSGAPPILAALLVFAAFYLAALYAGVLLHSYSQWSGLVAVVVATIATILILESGRWDLGFRGRPLVELLFGVVIAVALIGVADIAIVLTTPLHHDRGPGFPLGELLAVYLPAAVHEELLFRGYPFQKIWRANRTFAVLFVSLLFAALHAFNESVTLLALTNVFLGGVLLSLAYGIYERLWLPIGLHLAWNLMSGPILGYPVSGFIPEKSVFTTEGNGPLLLTGGGFGIEGSVLMTGVEVVAVLSLLRVASGKWQTRQRGNPQPATRNSIPDSAPE